MAAMRKKTTHLLCVQPALGSCDVAERDDNERECQYARADRSSEADENHDCV